VEAEALQLFALYCHERAASSARYHDDVTVHDVLIQYEGKLRELQTGMALVRLHHSLTAGALAIAIGMFLVLSLYAVRQQMSLLWPSLPIPVAAACASRYRRIRQSGFRMRRLKSF
jgi:hypothetical protein